ncbi:hypothetical protein BU14_0121s0001, partial [Porphyra umbilicalis]
MCTGRRRTCSTDPAVCPLHPAPGPLPPPDAARPVTMAGLARKFSKSLSHNRRQQEQATAPVAPGATPLTPRLPARTAAKPSAVPARPPAALTPSAMPDVARRNTSTLSSTQGARDAGAGGGGGRGGGGGGSPEISQSKSQRRLNMRSSSLPRSGSGGMAPPGMPGVTGTAATNVLRDTGGGGGGADGPVSLGSGAGERSQAKLKRFATLATARRENDGSNASRSFFRDKLRARAPDAEPGSLAGGLRAAPSTPADAESFMSPLAAFSTPEELDGGGHATSMGKLPSVRRNAGGVAASTPGTPRGGRTVAGDGPAFAPPRRQRRGSDETAAPCKGVERPAGALVDRGVDARGPPPTPAIAPEHRVLPPSMDVSNTFKRALQRIATEREELKVKLAAAEAAGADVEVLRSSTEELRVRLRVSDAAVAAEKDRLAAATSAAAELRREVSHLDASLRAAQRDAATA